GEVADGVVGILGRPRRRRRRLCGGRRRGGSGGGGGGGEGSGEQGDQHGQRLDAPPGPSTRLIEAGRRRDNRPRYRLVGKGGGYPAVAGRGRWTRRTANARRARRSTTCRRRPASRSPPCRGC